MSKFKPLTLRHILYFGKSTNLAPSSLDLHRNRHMVHNDDDESLLEFFALENLFLATKIIYHHPL